MKRRVVVTAGAIPAKLDSVKYITNRFRGRMGAATARFLAEAGHDVTMVCFRYSEVSVEHHPGIANHPDIKVILVDDVMSYYDVVLGLAEDADAIVLAAAVANLMPSSPYPGKFPSHLYDAGEKFSLNFEVAPRVIDAIKKANPRCCLIAYKLLDGSPKELIEAARGILKKSGANAVFANSLIGLNEKFMVLPEGGVVPMSYSDHNEWIDRIIRLQYNVSVMDRGFNLMPGWTGAVLEHFERYIRGDDEHGSCAIKTPKGMATTSRNHRGFSFVTGFTRLANDKFNREIRHFGPKPTKNVALLCLEVSYDVPIVHHLHRMKDALEVVDYHFPGTDEEVARGRDYYISGHGSILRHKLYPVDWKKYYEVFPERYFKIHPRIQEIYHMPLDEYETLDVGCNTKVRAKWGLDPFVDQNSYHLTYGEIQEGKFFDAIAINNSINYLEDEEIEILKASLKPGGRIVANTFRAAPERKVTASEMVASRSNFVEHVLWHGGKYYHHTFRNVSMAKWRNMGFTTTFYNSRKSALLEYKREK